MKLTCIIFLFFVLSQLVKWKIRNIKTLTYIQNHHFKKMGRNFEPRSYL